MFQIADKQEISNNTKKEYIRIYKNEDWDYQGSLRLTASNFYSIIHKRTE